MRIEYEVTADDFADASIAGALPRRAARAPVSGRFLPPWTIWAILAAVLAFVAALAIFVASIQSTPVEDDTPAASVRFFNAIARYESFWPWLVFALAVTYVALSSRSGRRAYRVASSVNGVVFAVLLVLTMCAGRVASEPSPLASEGVLRWAPWALVYNVVSAPLLIAWRASRFRPAFEASWYAREPRVATFDEDYVRDEGERLAVLYRWSAFGSVETTAQCVLFFTRGRQLTMFIPQRAIGDRAAVDALVAMVRSRLDGRRAFEIVQSTTAPVAEADAR